MGTLTEILPKEMNKDWEWFRFSSLIKPHFIPDGHGAYEVVVEVRFCLCILLFVRPLMGH